MTTTENGCSTCDGTGCPCLRARDWQSMEEGCDRQGCGECERNSCRNNVNMLAEDSEGVELPRTGIKLDDARRKLAGLHFSQESLTGGEREILFLAEGLLRLVDDVTENADSLGSFSARAIEAMSALYVVALNGKVCTPPDTWSDPHLGGDGSGSSFEIEALSCPECKAAWRLLVNVLNGEDSRG